MHLIISLPETPTANRMAGQAPPVKICERALYWLAKLLYRTELCLSSKMKEALASPEGYDAYRMGRINHILEAAARYGLSIEGKDVLDFGCANGVMCAPLLDHGARSVKGVDIDSEAIAQARALPGRAALSFLASEPDHIPLPDAAVDLVISYDVFEHVSCPEEVTAELFRVLRPGGQALIGTWGWHHPFAPHLFAAMPVPWAHLICSERSLIRACRLVYLSPWYRPTIHDFDAGGHRRFDKHMEESISTDYLNKYLIRDFEQVFRRSRFTFKSHVIPFGSWYARWTRVFLHFPWLREFLASYVWFVLTKPAIP
jgi:SAM-dependent methyltransferase